MTTNPKTKLKIFTGSGFIRGNTSQVDIFVAAPSRAKAVAALHAHGIHESAGRVASHWFCIERPETTAFAAQYSRAIAEPGQVFASSKYGATDFQPLAKLDIGENNDDQARASLITPSRGPSM